MFSFFKRFKGSKESDNAPEESQTAPEALAPEPAVEAPQAPVAPSAPQPVTPVRVDTQPAAAASANEPEAEAPALETVEIVPPPMQDANAKRSWLTRLKTGLSKTSSSLTGIFVGTKIDEDLYEELETALLMSDAGVEATEFLLESLREILLRDDWNFEIWKETGDRVLLAELVHGPPLGTTHPGEQRKDRLGGEISFDLRVPGIRRPRQLPDMQLPTASSARFLRRDPTSLRPEQESTSTARHSSRDITLEHVQYAPTSDRV